jgi:hypothetical protein
MAAELHPSGTAGVPPLPSRGRRRRWRLALLLVVVLLACAWIAREMLLEPLLVRLAEGAAAERGWKLEIGSVEGLSLRGIGVRDTRVEPLEPTSPVRSIRVRKVACKIDLAELLKGRVSGLRSISAEGIEADLDLTRSPEPSSAGGGIAIEIPAYLPRVDVSDSSVRASLANGKEVLLEGIEIHAGEDTRAPDGGAAVSARLVLGRVVAPWSIGRLEPRVELTAVASPGELRIEEGRVTAGEHHVEARDVRMPLAFESGAALLKALRGEFHVDTPDPVELALGRVIEPRIAGHLGAELRMDSGSVVVTDGAVEVPEGSLERLRGSLDLVSLLTGGASPIEVESEVDLVDLAPLGSLLGLEAWTGELTGRARLSGDVRAPRLDVALAGDGISIASRPLGAVAFEASTDFRSVQVDSFHSRGDAGELELSGGVDLVAHELANVQLGAELAHPELLLAGLPAMEIALDARLDGPWSAPSGVLRARAPVLDLAGARLAAVFLDASLREGTIDVHSLVGSTDVGSFEANGTLDLLGSPRSIELELASFDREPDRSSTEKLLELCAILPEASEGHANDPGREFSLLANARWPAGWTRMFVVSGVMLDLTQSARMELDLAGSTRAPHGAFTIAVPAMRIVPTVEGADSVWTGALDARVAVDDSIVLERFEIVSGTSEVLRASGRSLLQPDLEELVASHGGTFLDAPCELDVRGELSELAWLARLSPQIRRASGVFAVDAHLEGTPRDLRPKGKLELRKGELRLASSFPVIEGIEGSLVLEDRRVLAVDLAAEIGSAPLSIEGEIDLEPATPTLDLTVRGESVLLARTSTVRLRSDADLRIEGTLAAPRISGKIDLRSGRIRKDFEFLSAVQGRGVKTSTEGITIFSFPEPPLSTLVFDLEIAASEAIELDSNVVRGKLRPQLRLAGTGAIPTLEGRVFLDDLVLYLPGGHFRFPGGWVQFDRADPFHPTLDLHGQARLAGHDVTMAVSGPVDDPTVDLSSSPPLARDRLILLVLSGVLPPEDLKGSGNQATRSITLYVAKDMFSRWMGSGGDESDESLFDRLEITTGSEASKGGVLSTEASLRVREGAFVKNDAVLLVAERDTYEDYNMGVRIVFHFR